MNPTPTNPPANGTQRISVPRELLENLRIIAAQLHKELMEYENHVVAVHRESVRADLRAVDLLLSQPTAPTVQPEPPTTECLQGQPGDTCQHAFCQPAPATGTPRTDAASYEVSKPVREEITLPADCHYIVDSRDMAALETELQAAQAEVTRLRADCAVGENTVDELNTRNADTLAKLEGVTKDRDYIASHWALKCEGLEKSSNDMAGWVASKMLQPEWDSFKKSLEVIEYWKDQWNKQTAERDDIRAKLTAAEQQVAELTKAVDNYAMNLNFTHQRVAELTRDGKRMGERYAGILSDFATAQRDTERLDFLDENMRLFMTYSEPENNGNWHRLEFKHRTDMLTLVATRCGPTVRAAIDAALRPSDAQ